MASTLPSRASSEAPFERARAIEDVIASLAIEDRRLAPAELERLALTVAGRHELWDGLVVDSPDERWWIVLHRTDGFEVRLLSWEYDQSSGWHDHAGSSGGFVVTSGALHELSRQADGCSIAEASFGPGAHGSFGAEHVHNVEHEAGRPAVSIHAYSPPLTMLTMYRPTPYGFVATEVVPDDTRTR